MGRQIKQEIVLDGEAARREAEGFGRTLEDVGKKGEKAFQKADNTLSDMARGGAIAAMASQAASAWSAVTAPALSTYGQLLDRAAAFRKETTVGAIGAGMAIQEMRGRIENTSRTLAIMPDVVMNYVTSVGQVTGSWETADSAMSAYYSRSLKLGKPLDAMRDQHSLLENMFGISDAQRVNQFFEKTDAQAQALGQNFRKLDILSQSMTGNLARITSASPEALSAVNATFLKGNKGNVDRAASNEQGVVSWVKNKEEYIARSMVRAGKLKKTEDFWDEEGNIKDLPGAIAFEADKQRKFVAKNAGGRRILAQNMGGRQVAAALLNYHGEDQQKALTAKPTEQEGPLAWLLDSAYGKRVQSDVGKAWKDIQAGKSLLPYQDYAAEKGGGWAGVGVDTAGKIGLGAAATAALKTLKGGAKPAAAKVASVAPEMVEKWVWQGDAEFGKWAIKQVPKIAPRVAPSMLKAASYTGSRLLGPLLGNVLGPLVGQMMFPSETGGAESKPAAGAKTLAQLGPYGSARLALQDQQVNEQKHNQSFFRFLEPAPRPLSLPKEITTKLTPADIKALGQEFGNSQVGKVLKVQVVDSNSAPSGPRAPH